ncbi:MAG: DUF5615 family PIN-like protein [Dehalococcoidia bacterium]|nr:DUF5615 family PIN-like protein [Dehalococcoidia bacterium]
MTTHEAGNRRLPDPEQLEFAVRNSLVMYTANTRDFAALHRVWATAERDHFGIIVRTNQRLPVASQLRALRRLLTTMRLDDLDNQLLFLENWLA